MGHGVVWQLPKLSWVMGMGGGGLGGSMRISLNMNIYIHINIWGGRLQGPI